MFCRIPASPVVSFVSATSCGRPEAGTCFLLITGGDNHRACVDFFDLRRRRRHRSTPPHSFSSYAAAGLRQTISHEAIPKKVPRRPRRVPVCRKFRSMGIAQRSNTTTKIFKRSAEPKGSILMPPRWFQRGEKEAPKNPRSTRKWCIYAPI